MKFDIGKLGIILKDIIYLSVARIWKSVYFEEICKRTKIYIYFFLLFMGLLHTSIKGA